MKDEDGDIKMEMKHGAYSDNPPWLLNAFGI